MGDVLVFAEQKNGHLPKTTLIALGAGLELARRQGGRCIAATAGKQVDVAADTLANYGVSEVLALEHPALEHYVADAYAQALAAVATERGVETILASSTAVGKDLMPRLAARLGAAMASDVIEFEEDGTFVRPMYAGNALATVELTGVPKVITVRTTAFEPAAASQSKAPVSKLTPKLDEKVLKMRFVKFEETKSERPQLTEAQIVVSGGRGLRSAENFKTVLEPLVDELGAAMGASRAAVDAGFVPNDLQVGQTGKVVAPALYIAVGISGAIQHLAGMKDSKVIVAINKDEEAPIFNVADYGLVADLFKAVPEMVEEIRKLKRS